MSRKLATAKDSLYHHPLLARHAILRVAGEAICDPRCVVKYLRDMPMTSNLRARIAYALKKCGFVDLVHAREANKVHANGANGGATNGSSPPSTPLPGLVKPLMAATLDETKSSRKPS